MGLSSCAKFIKYLLVIINILFWVIGLAAVFLFIWVFADPSILLSMTQDQSNFYAGMCVFLIGGVIMLIISILGCCGSIKESHCMLMTFFCFLLLVLVAQIAAGSWAIHNKSFLVDDMFRVSVKNTVQNEYGVIQEKTDAFDTFQRHLECCGANGPNDWALSKFNSKETTNTINMKISSSTMHYKIPESCCKTDVHPDQCMLSTKVTLKSVINSDIHSQGCMDKLVHEFHSNITLVCGILTGIVIVEFLGLLFALILYCAIKNKENYKS